MKLSAKDIIVVLFILTYSVMCIYIGYKLGSANVTEKIKTVYIKGEAIEKPVSIPPITDSTSPTEIDYSKVPMKHDTTYLQVSQVIDTAALIKDYIALNSYVIEAFNDSTGKLVLEPKVQYNKLASLSYTFTPVYKQTTITKIKRFVPYLSLGINTFNYVNAGAGFFYNKYGIEYNYNYSPGISPYHQVSLKYKL